MGVPTFMQKNGRSKKPEKARPVATVVIAPGPVFWIRSGFVLPFQAVHRGVADPHGHLGHEVVAVVEHQSKQRPLLRTR